jgi:hypothetical protein
VIRGAVVAATLGAALGCHSGGPSKNPAPTPAVDAGVDAELIDPSTAALLAALRDQLVRACACADRGCAEDADALAVQWGMDHRDIVQTLDPTASQQHELAGLVAAAEDCLDRWLQ